MIAHLRSPTERALSMADLAHIAAPFRRGSHWEFVLLSVLPALQPWLAQVDRRLFDTAPAVGRYAWETVVVLEK